LTDADRRSFRRDQDRDGAGRVLDKIRRRFPYLEPMWAYGGYNAWQVLTLRRQRRRRYA